MVSLNIESSGDTDAVNNRTAELMAEFEDHFRDTINLDPSIAEQREHVFQAWTFQKLAGIQLCIEEIANNFNQHVDAE